MDLLIVVSTESAAPLFSQLAQACARAKCDWSVFFTYSGARVAADAQTEALVQTATHAIVCHDSWDRFVNVESNVEPQIEMGSQTNHSEMAGQAGRVVSL